jgi:hypothetical protein
MDQHKPGNLLFQPNCRLFALRFDQSGAQLTVETLQILRYLSALILVQRGLQVANYQEGVVDVASAPLNVVAAMRFARAPQVFDRLLIQQNHQP